MSRIGKKPVDLSGAKVNITDRILKIEGKNCKLEQWIDPNIGVEIEGDSLVFTPKGNSKKVKALHGLYRSIAQNMVDGVNKGHEKQLELVGVGYDADIRGKGLYLELGLAHANYFHPPDGITFEVTKPKTKVEAKGTASQYLIATISVKGIDKTLVGQVAAKIRAMRVPDVYKSKGIRYFGERVQLKAGKSGAGA